MRREPTAGTCCECGSPKVAYHNYPDEPFCWPCASPPLRPRLRIYLEPRDAWIGLYVAKDAIYACLLPFLVIRWWRKPAREPMTRRRALFAAGWALGIAAIVAVLVAVAWMDLAAQGYRP